MVLDISQLDPSIWGPPYWFVLHSIALTYPANPNEVIRKKYYNFIQNLPLFLPVHQIGNTFAEILEKYPVAPYLDSQKSFVKWMHFIHNKINKKIGVKEISMEDALDSYYNKYAPIDKENEIKKYKLNKKHNKYKIYGGIIIGLLLLAIVINKKK